MEDEIKFYEKVIEMQLQLRKALQKEPFGNPRLMDIVDEEINMLNEIIIHLRERKK
jgi:hypothetical protein